MKKQKVLVAMSGGVDSAVAAALLLERGYDVSGGFIKNWSQTKDPNTGSCSWRTERRDAIRVAAQLGIPLITFDFEKQYRKKIVDELYKGYEKGLTPNPDVLCNEYIKFGLFWDQAQKIGFDLMATGHYAIVKQGKTATLWRGKDTDKDQSYFLYRISPDALNHSLMPIGDYKKAQIRALAKKYKFKVADKPDSQGICFIGKIDFQQFLSQKISNKPGSIITPDGKKIGEHLGLHNYTIGQRSKIAVADKHPWYVADKNIKDNTLIVVSDPKDKYLQTNKIILDDLHWLSGKEPSNPVKILVQVRYRQKPLKAELTLSKNKQKATLNLSTPAQAAAIGQSAVIYQGEQCLGGGIIRQVEHLC